MKEIIAKRVKLIDSSGIRKVFALAAELKDPVNFSIGQPDFDVADALKEEAIKAIKDVCEDLDITREQVEKMFHRNAEQLLRRVLDDKPR